MQVDLVIDFGVTYGIWTYHNDTTWNCLHDLTAEALVVEDFDGDGRDEIVISFGAAGLWRNKNGAWTLHQASVSALVTGRIH